MINLPQQLELKLELEHVGNFGYTSVFTLDQKKVFFTRISR